MKNKKLITAFVIFCLIFPAMAKSPGLEETLSDAVSKISDAIDGKVKTVAVLDIRSEHWALSDYIVGILNDEFANTLQSTNVAERDEYSLALIQKEQDYQLSGNVSDETIQEIGMALGVDCIVLGNMESVSGGWQLILRASTVESKKVLYSWRGKISSKEKEVKFQVEKSKNPRPAVKLPADKTHGAVLSAFLINEKGENVVSLRPKDVIRISVSSKKSAYLAILCIDAKGEESWLPLENNYIRSGETRIFPDIAGAVLRVEEGMFGNEKIIVYAADTERDLPMTDNVMTIQDRSRKLSLTSGITNSVSTTINYSIVK